MLKQCFFKNDTASKEREQRRFTFFAYLIKACSSVNHGVTSLALEKMGASPKCTKCVEKLHGNFNAVLKVGNVETEIGNGCGLWKVKMSHLIY